ncbi:biopolymer transporter ExbD [Gracilimonas sp.]|uniref:ExbD/TolR family protein n=1 Tax=Gracilimonas sp. TaxID=1974203 RepID=UPI0032F02249
MLFSKPFRSVAKINGSSLADIAFLLLIFFLVTTTINVDTGIGLTLPHPLNDTKQEIKERNLMKILVNAEGEVMMDNKKVQVSEIKNTLKSFINNFGENREYSESPQMAIVSLMTVRETPYKVYIDMLDEVMGAYDELRNEKAIKSYGRSYPTLNDSERKYIKESYPKKISIAEKDSR